MSQFGFVALALAMVAAAYMGSRRFPYDPGLGELRSRLDALRNQVESWQTAHDHQVRCLDRRMSDVETAAARAEGEARIVSVQMEQLSEGLMRRLELVEQREEIERLASGGSI